LNPFPDEKDPRKLYIRAVLSILAEVHAKTELAQHLDAPPANSLDALRDSFAKVRNTVDALVANLTEEQMLRLSNPKTSVAEKKRFLMETLARVGVTSVTEKDLD
jgi:hypothetical protein